MPRPAPTLQQSQNLLVKLSLLCHMKLGWRQGTRPFSHGQKLRVELTDEELTDEEVSDMVRAIRDAGGGVYIGDEDYGYYDK